MKKIFAIIFCSVCCGITATAQTTYTLEQLKQLAVDNNYTLNSSKNAIQQAKQTEKSALTNFFPQISASGVAFQNNKPLIDIDVELPEAIQTVLGGMGISDIPSNISLLKKGVIGSVSAIQPVFMGGKIINSNKLARVGVEASELRLELSEDQVEMTTEQYYWQMVSLKEKKKTLTAMHSMLTELEKDVNNMVRVGARNRNDLLQVQLRKAEVETSILEIDNGLTTTSQLLAQHVGKTGETIDVMVPVELAEGKTVDMPLSLRQDHATALNATPQYQLLAKNVEAQKLQHRMQIGANLPQVAVGALYNYNDFMGKNSNAMMFATVRVPISDWWGGSHKIKKQRLALDDAKEQMQDNGQKLIIRMNNAWSAVETSYKKLQIARDAITQAEENLRLHKDYYRVGTTNMTDLLLAEEHYQQACDRYTDAYADFQTKQLDYRQATGQK